MVVMAGYAKAQVGATLHKELLAAIYSLKQAALTLPWE
jgi:hypothetical protein